MWRAFELRKCQTSLTGNRSPPEEPAAPTWPNDINLCDKSSARLPDACGWFQISLSLSGLLLLNHNVAFGAALLSGVVILWMATPPLVPSVPPRFWIGPSASLQADYEGFNVPSSSSLRRGGGAWAKGSVHSPRRASAFIRPAVSGVQPAL